MKKIMCLLAVLMLVSVAAFADDVPYRQQRRDHFSQLPIDNNTTVFLGNSITNFGVWPEIFAGNDTKVVNRGISGNFSKEVMAHFNLIIDQKPKAIYLMIGINDVDAQDDIVPSVERMLQIAKEVSSSTKIYVQSILPTTYSGRTAIPTTINPQLKLICDQYSNATYVDVYTAMNEAGVANIMDDQLHPKWKGYQIWANQIQQQTGLTTKMDLTSTYTNQFATNLYYQDRILGEYALLPVESTDVLMMGDGFVQQGEWAELFSGNANVKNRGIGLNLGNSYSLTSERLLTAIPQMLHGSATPAKVFIEVGATDAINGTAYSTIVTNIESCVAKIKELSSSTKIYVQSIIPLRDATKNTTIIKPANDELQTWCATQDNVEYIDLYSTFIDSSDKLAAKYQSVYSAGYGANIALYIKWANLIKSQVDATPLTELDENYHLFKPSTTTETHWYTLTANGATAANAAKRYVTSNGAGVGITGELFNGKESQQWKFVANGTGYDIINRATGDYIDPSSASNNSQLKTSASQPSAVWTIQDVESNQYCIIKSESVELNQTTSAHSYQVYNWGSGTNTTDGGCLFYVEEAGYAFLPDNSIDYLMVYDKNAQDVVSSKSYTLTQHAQLCIDQLNQVMKNSGISGRYRLAGVMGIDNKLTGTENGLSAATSNTSVLDKRYACKADVVCVVVTGTAGESVGGSSIQAAPLNEPENAVCSVLADNDTPVNVAHETAHVMGCNHSRTMSDAGTHEYAVAYENGIYHTLLSDGGSSETAVNHLMMLSGPDNYAPDGTTVMGTATADNTRMVKEMWDRVAGFSDRLQSVGVSENTWAPTASAQNKSLTVTCNNSFNVTSSETWAKGYTLVSGKGGDEEYTSGCSSSDPFYISVEANTSTEARTATISISASGYASAVITITQAGAAEQSEGSAYFNFSSAAVTSGSTSATLTNNNITAVVTTSNASGLGSGTSTYTLTDAQISSLNTNINQTVFSNADAQSYISAGAKSSSANLTITISGLRAGKSYSISLVSGLDKEGAGSWNSITSDNTVGSSSPALGAEGISAAALTPYIMTGVVADSEGKIVLKVNSTNGTHTAVINSLGILKTSADDPVVPTFAASNLFDLATGWYQIEYYKDQNSTEQTTKYLLTAKEDELVVSSSKYPAGFSTLESSTDFDEQAKTFVYLTKGNTVGNNGVWVNVRLSNGRYMTYQGVSSETAANIAAIYFTASEKTRIAMSSSNTGTSRQSWLPSTSGDEDYVGYGTNIYPTFRFSPVTSTDFNTWTVTITNGATDTQLTYTGSANYGLDKVFNGGAFFFGTDVTPASSDFSAPDITGYKKVITVDSENKTITLAYSLIGETVTYTLNTDHKDLGNLLPQPRSVNLTGSSCNLTGGIAVTVSGNKIDKPSAVGRFISEVGLTTGTDITLNIKYVGAITGTEDYTVAGFDNEAYALKIDGQTITVSAIDTIGVVRAMQTLTQMAKENTTLTGCEIVDWPAFKVRGLMHDIGRSYISVAELKKEIDLLARFKENVFLWHLTDKHGFRFESKQHPKVNTNFSPTRSQSYYTQAECKEVMNYARERGIMVIPEIDMPGHSARFEGAMGYTMASEEGRATLKVILNEVADVFNYCPYIHIGGDETNDATLAYINEMADYIHDNLDRKVVVWNKYGGNSNRASVDPTTLHVDMSTNWATSGVLSSGIPNIDMRYNYINHFDMFGDLAGIYRSNIFGVQKGNADVAGSITGIWNDRLISDEKLIIKENNMYANALATAERGWKGGGLHYSDDAAGGAYLPNSGTEYEEFKSWETRFLYHKGTTLSDVKSDIPYVKQTNVVWNITQGYANEGDATKTFAPETTENLQPKPGSIFATGAGIWLNHIWAGTVAGVLGKTAQSTNQTRYAWTYVYSESEKTVGAYIETYNYSRSQMGAAPAKGKWDYLGSRVWVNDEEIVPTWDWTTAGSGEETELGNVNFTTRDPMKITLKAGWNKVLLKLPYIDNSVGYYKSKWQYTFVFTDESGENAAEGLIYSPSQSKEGVEKIVADPLVDGKYYTLKDQRGSKYAQSNGAGNGMTGTTSTSAQSIWQLVAKEDGTYNFKNFADGSYIAPVTSYNSQMQTSADAPASGWTIATVGDNGYVILTNTNGTQTNQLHQATGANVLNWGWSPATASKNTSDGGCLYLIERVEDDMLPRKVTVTCNVEGTAIYEANNYRLGLLNVNCGNTVYTQFNKADNGTTKELLVNPGKTITVTEKTPYHGWKLSKIERSASDTLHFDVTYTADATDRSQVLWGNDAEFSYRIPAIGTTSTGRIIAVSDYRHSLDDIGRYNYGTANPGIDLVSRYSDDNGKTWSDEVTVKLGSHTRGTDDCAFGDAAIACCQDKKVVVFAAAGDVVYSNCSASSHNRMARLYSEDNGLTYTYTDITEKMIVGESSLLPDAYGLFFGSGKLAVDNNFNGTGKTRIYGALLIKDATSSAHNYVVFSDDLGENWKILGGSTTEICNADEPKVEILPNGQILLSSRRVGGRKFNIFTYGTGDDDKTNGTGTWGTAANGCSNGGSNGTNGEIFVTRARKADGTATYLLLQSQPKGGSGQYDRRDVTIWYKEISGDASYAVSDITDGWTQGKQISTVLSSYSTMTLQENGELGFFFEEAPCYDDNYAKGYCMIYVPLTIEDITGNSYLTPAYLSKTAESTDQATVLSGTVTTPTAVADMVTTGTGSVDITETTIAAGVAIEDVKSAVVEKTGNSNTLIYAPSGTSVESTTNNVVVDGSCQSLVLTDGDAMSIPTEFTADKATYSRNSTNKWGTICLPYDFESTDLILYYELSSVDEGKSVMTFTPVTTVAAGTPAVFKVAETGNNTITAESIQVIRTLSTSGTVTWTMHGTYEKQTITDANGYYIKDDQFWQRAETVGSCFYINPFRGWFTTTSNPSARVYDISFDDPTGIQAVENADGTVSVVYDLKGHRQNAIQKGVNIIDGRKVIK